MATLCPIDVTGATPRRGPSTGSRQNYFITVVVVAVPAATIVVVVAVPIAPPAIVVLVVVATEVVGTVPVMGVWCFFELEQPATTAALRARAATNTLNPREVMF